MSTYSLTPAQRQAWFGNLRAIVSFSRRFSSTLTRPGMNRLFMGIGRRPMPLLLTPGAVGSSGFGSILQPPRRKLDTLRRSFGTFGRRRV
jgi:hypothetical protein